MIASGVSLLYAAALAQNDRGSHGSDGGGFSSLRSSK